VIILLVAVSLVGPFSVAPAMAQDEAPADEVMAEVTTSDEDTTTEQAPAEQPAAEEQVAYVEQAPPTVLTGSLQIRLTDTNGVGLSGLFALTDGSGAYHERWTEGGVAWFPELVVGTAAISQLSGTTDYAFDGSTYGYIDVPAGSHVVLSMVNAFLDADGDGYGDSVDRCAAGSDAVDTDADGTPDACDEPLNGDDDADHVDNAVDACPAGDDATDGGDDSIADTCDDTAGGVAPVEPVVDETDEEALVVIAVDVAAEPVVVQEAPVSCRLADAVAPWITTDLADYPPSSLVTLTGGNWVGGQTIEILVEDDGLTDAERGPWSHAATATADAQGGFTYHFNIAPWYVANYSIVVTGECSEAKTAFTDSFMVTTATVNGGASTTVGPGATISATVTVSRSAANDNWQYTSWQISGGQLVCVDTQNFSGIGTSTVAYPITAPAASGEYDVEFRAYSNANCNGTQFGTPRTLLKGIIVSAAPGPCTATASLAGSNLNFGSSAWDGTSYPTITGALAIQISSSGTNCSGFPSSWTVQASTGVMNRSGGGTIPGTAISYTGTGSGSPPTGLTPSGAKALGGTAQVIATGNATTSTGTWTAGFSLAPSSSAEPGTYTGSITITIPSSSG
jgi:hypothetical protein